MHMQKLRMLEALLVSMHVLKLRVLEVLGKHARVKLFALETLWVRMHR